MCEAMDYDQCECECHRKRQHIGLTVLLLDCWQREYDERPYKHFQISRISFENRMRRTFNELDWSVLIEFLQLRDLESVGISHISLPEGEDLTGNLVKGLLNVETLQLRGVSLPGSFLQEFHRNIFNCRVKSLDLSENDLVSSHLLALRCILIESSTLTHLSVGSCFMNENTFPILADGVHKSRSIKCLDISRLCPMSAVSTFESLKFVSTVAQLIWQNKLTELHLRQCNLNGHDMEPIAEYLASPSSGLLILDLSGNNIVSHGTEYLFKALAGSNALRELNIGSNNLGPKGAQVIARQLVYTNLRSLDIAHNQITSEALYELLVSIKKPCELKVLKIFGNQFNQKTAHVLRRLLKAKVLSECNVDVTYTWDHCREELCVIPALASGRVHT